MECCSLGHYRMGHTRWAELCMPDVRGKTLTLSARSTPFFVLLLTPFSLLYQKQYYADLISKMGTITPLLAAFVALLAQATDTVQALAAPVPNSETVSLPEGLISSQGASSPRYRGQRTRLSSPLGIAFLATTVVTVLFIIQCFRALQSNKSQSSYLVTNRRLAEAPDPDECDVSVG